MSSRTLLSAFAIGLILLFLTDDCAVDSYGEQQARLRAAAERHVREREHLTRTDIAMPFCRFTAANGWHECAVHTSGYHGGRHALRCRLHLFNDECEDIR